MADVLGYSFNNGGLNNQKLALLGLFIAGFQQKTSIIFPFFYSKDVPREKNSYQPLDNHTVPIHDIFDATGIERLAKKYNISIDPSDPSELPMGGWDYFGLGAGSSSALALSTETNETTALVRDFFLNVVPLARRSYIVSRLKHDIFPHSQTRFFQRDDELVAAQFRIESDWKFYSTVALRPTVGNNEDYDAGYDRIVAKIKRTIPNAKRVLVICDEAAVDVPKEEMRHVSRRKFKLDLIWKSDFLTPFEIKALGPLALSMIDFELALGADKFVGLSRSTFSNMITLEKFAARRSRITSDFIYNNDSLDLHLRTDNGGHADPREATKQV